MADGVESIWCIKYNNNNNNSIRYIVRWRAILAMKGNDILEMFHLMAHWLPIGNRHVWELRWEGLRDEKSITSRAQDTSVANCYREKEINQQSRINITFTCVLSALCSELFANSILFIQSDEARGHRAHRTVFPNFDKIKIYIFWSVQSFWVHGAIYDTGVHGITDVSISSYYLMAIICCGGVCVLRALLLPFLRYIFLVINICDVS